MVEEKTGLEAELADLQKKKAEVQELAQSSKEEIDQLKQEKVELLDRIEALENKEPEIREVEVERIVEVENTDGIDALNKDVIKLQAEVASRDAAIERISKKYDLVDKKARTVIDESQRC